MHSTARVILETEDSKLFLLLYLQKALLQDLAIL